MTTDANIEGLIADVKQVVARGIAYVQANAESEVKIDIWTPRETLCHMIYWHRAIAEGMESVAAGGEPHRVYASADEMNARSVGRKSGWSVAFLVEEMEELQERLVSAVRSLSDTGAAVIAFPGGSEESAEKCLRDIAAHWAEHLEEMAAADAEAAAAGAPA